MEKIQFSINQLLDLGINSTDSKEQLSDFDCEKILNFCSYDKRGFIHNENEYRIFCEYQTFFLVTKNEIPFFLICMGEPTAYISNEDCIAFSGHDSLTLLNLNTLKVTSTFTR